METEAWTFSQAVWSRMERGMVVTYEGTRIERVFFYANRRVEEKTGTKEIINRTYPEELEQSTAQMSGLFLKLEGPP